MATTELTKANFEEVVGKGGIVLVDWWAPWCGPCRAFGPVYEKVAENHPDIAFGKVNSDEQPELAGAFDIRSIPTLMIFRDKVLLFAEPGAIPASTLEELIRQTRALDMDEVRKKVEEIKREMAERDSGKTGAN